MEQKKLTAHMIKDRSDRATYILLHVGQGDHIIKEQRCVDKDGKVSWQCLTNTGVLLVLDESKETIITMYVAAQPKVSAMYEGKTPSWVFNLVRKNKKHAENQNKVRYINGKEVYVR